MTTEIIHTLIIAGFACLALGLVALLIGVKTKYNINAAATVAIFAIVYGAPYAAACYLFTLAAR